MTLSFLADEHVSRVFVVELHSNGYDVATVGKDYREGTPDVEHLEQSRVNGRVILSNDSDFTRLHENYDHAGIVLYTDQTMPVSEFIRGIKRVERYVPEAELRNRIVWLDDWID